MPMGEKNGAGERRSGRWGEKVNRGGSSTGRGEVKKEYRKQVGRWGLRVRRMLVEDGEEESRPTRKNGNTGRFIRSKKC